MKCRTIAALVAGLAALLCSTQTWSASWTEMPLQFVVLRTASLTDMKEFVRRVEAAGGHASVVTSSQTALVYADTDLLLRPELETLVADAHLGAVESQRMAGFGSQVVKNTEIWNAVLTTRDAESGHVHEDVDLLQMVRRTPDAGPRPAWVGKNGTPPRINVSDNMPLGAEYYDTSEFLAGSTAVGVWLLEAAGPTYDWSGAEETQTLGGVVSGMDNWVRKGGAPAFLTFYIENHTQVPVSGVPIENPQSSEAVWIDEALTNAGWTGPDAFEKCFAYNNAIRDLYDTNWCASIFIVDSDPSVNQGLFVGGGYAWAYYGGPWVYMSRYSTWAFGASRYFAAVPMHEMGHIFMDTDEYDGFVQTQGYLNQSDNPSAAVQCIMNQNDSSKVCQQTRNQLGWRDLTANTIYDAMDIQPIALVDENLPDPTTDVTPTWTGTVNVQTVTNLNPQSWYFPRHNMTVATIDQVQVRINMGPWEAATPTDGAFDDYVEGYTWTSAPLIDGTYIAQARAHTRAGNWTTTYDPDTRTVSSGVAVPGSRGLDFTLEPSVPSPLRSSGSLRFALPAEAMVRLDLFAIDGSRVRTLMSARAPAGATTVRWDGRDESGQLAPAGVYFAKLETPFGALGRRIVLVR